MTGGYPGSRAQDTHAERDAFTAAGNQTIVNLGGAAGLAVSPGLLPRDVPGFTGRDEELARIERLARGGSVVVTAIDGTAGVGKTALAIHAAHMLLATFPDGHLYADLRGFSDGQDLAAPGEILAMFLGRLGVPASELPADLEQRSGLFRQALSSRRMVVILDNVANEAQVRPLLPGTGASLVLITSRATLAGLELDERINLDTLSATEAIELFGRVAGQERIAAEPDAVRQVVSLCGCLPLALRIAAQLLAAHHGWTVERLAGSLADEQRRLDILAVGDRQVRSAFTLSYQQLPAEDARVFRLLSLFPGQGFHSFEVASLLNLDVEAAGHAMDRLALANLIISDAGDRFRLHDLLRLFAHEACLADEDDAARNEALIRLLGHFRSLALFLDVCIDPALRAERAEAYRQAGLSLPALREALAIFETELPSMLAVLVMASELHQHDAVWSMAENMGDALLILWRPTVFFSVYQVALDAARAAGDQGAELRALGNLGNAYLQLGEFDEAHTYYRRILEIQRKPGGNRRDAGIALRNLGTAYRGLGQFGLARESYQEALEIAVATGDRRSEGQTLNNLGNVYAGSAKLELAVASYQEALKIRREIGDQRGEGESLNSLGGAYLRLRQPSTAIASYQEALKVRREVGHRRGEALTLSNLGSAYVEMGQLDEAVASYREALEIRRAIGDRRGEGQTLYKLGSLYQRQRRFDKMESYLTAAVQAFDDSGDQDAGEQARKSLLSDRKKKHFWWLRVGHRDPTS